MAEPSTTPTNAHPMRLVVSISVIEVGTGVFSTTRDTERIWHQEHVTVPLERASVLDVNEMVDRAIHNVVVVAGRDGKE